MVECGGLEILSETAVYKLRGYHELEIKSAVGKAELLKPTKCDLSAALPRRSHRTADRGMAGELVHGAGGRAVLSYCSGLVAMAPRAASITADLVDRERFARSLAIVAAPRRRRLQSRMQCR